MWILKDAEMINIERKSHPYLSEIKLRLWKYITTNVMLSEHLFLHLLPQLSCSFEFVENVDADCIDSEGN